MSALKEWEARNVEYLSAAVDMVRMRLESLGSGRHVPGPSPSPARMQAPAESNPDGVFRKLFNRIPASGNPGPETLLLSPPSTAQAMERAAERLANAGKGEPTPAFIALCRRLDLSDFERDILLLCIVMELDTGIAALCARAQGPTGPSSPTFALAMAMSPQPAWEALSPDRPLRYFRLIEIIQNASLPLTLSALRADERIVNFTKGLKYLDDRLAPLLLRVELPPQMNLPHSQQESVERIFRSLTVSSKERELICLRGRDRESKLAVAGAVAAKLGAILFRIPSENLPAHPVEIETLAKLWRRECMLLPLALYIDAQDLEKSPTNDGPANWLGRFLARTGGILFLDTRDGLESPVAPLVDLEIRKPDPGEQEEAWRSAIGARSRDLPRLLAGQFDLNQNDISAISALTAEDADPEGFDKRMWSACRERTRPNLERLADKIETKATWETLILPEQETALLRQIGAQVRARSQVYDGWGFRSRMNRGFGISALFAGESGTGKTMAAEVLANDLNLDLFRIDLSAVVSKYIGESEKKMRDVFDAAENGGAIIFFDEADALFGKRSEVKDSHDRFANIGINYLLQRMESFRGLAVLATNMKSALDTAFLRRLRFIVNFAYPAPAERRRMWEKAFPNGAPLEAVDYERLAKLNLTGGNIHSVALNAAFLAAHGGTPITMNLLFEAARTEFRKLNRPINESDFRYSGPFALTENRSGAIQ